MATYAELYALVNDSDLQERVAVALAVKADAFIQAGSLSAKQQDWIAALNPIGMTKEYLWLLLAGNKAASVATIQAADDSTIQTKVSAAVDALLAAAV